MPSVNGFTQATSKPKLSPLETDAATTVDTWVRAAAPPAQRVLAALQTAQTRYQLFLPDQAVVVAVSGGADSVCLLHALHQLAPLWRVTLHIAHLDHALRPESAEDAAFVAKLARQLNVPLHQARLAPDTLHDDPHGLEAAARTARYAFLRQVAMRLPENATVATAHHQDDQAETLLLHLIQGSGLHGLAGMAWVAQVPDNLQPRIRLVRPLLGVSRAEILAYLQGYALSWREDSSNLDPTYIRNQLRHRVLPELATINPNIHATLARTASILAAEAEQADTRDRSALEALTREATPTTRIALDWFRLAQTAPAIQRGVLRQALLTLDIDLRTVGLDGIDRLLEQAQTAASPGPHPLSAGWSWTLWRGANRAVNTEVVATASADASGQTSQPDHPILSIHRDDALPITVHHPHIPDAIPSPRPIPQHRILTCGAWQLHSDTYAPANLPDNWRSRDHTWRLFADADAAGDLALTTFRPGMSIAPLGLQGHHRSLGDIFTDHKVPPFLRAGWPVVVNSRGEVVWLCGLVVSERVRVHAKTRRVRHLSWQLARSTA